MLTMELQSDTEQQIKKMMSLVEIWTSIQPAEYEISEKSEVKEYAPLQDLIILNKTFPELCFKTTSNSRNTE